MMWTIQSYTLTLVFVVDFFIQNVTWGVGKKIKNIRQLCYIHKQAHVLGIKKRDYGIVIICTSVVRLFIIFNFKRGNNRSRIQNMSAINVGIFIYFSDTSR